MIPRDPGEAILAKFTDRLGYLSDVDRRATPWRSATFAGERHDITFTVSDGVDIASFVKASCEMDIPIRNGFVADVAVVETSAGPHGIRLRVEALTIDA